MSDSLCLETLSFSPSRTIQDIASSFTFGTISKATASIPISIDTSEIKFLVFPVTQSPPVAATSVQRSTKASGSPSTPLEHIRASEVGSFDVRLKDDDRRCFISGLSITQDGKRILVDNHDHKVKLFSPNVTYLSSVSALGVPWDVTVLNNQEAAVTLDYSLVIFGISGRQLRVKEMTQLS